MKNIPMLLLAAVITAQCTEHDTSGDELVKSAAQGFATSFFNYDFQQAGSLATPESSRWLRYAASNVSQADIDFVNSLETEAVAKAVDIEWTSDSTASVSLEVRHVALRDSVEGGMRLADEASFTLSVVLRDGQPLVRMAGPLRSEMQSRD